MEKKIEKLTKNQKKVNNKKYCSCTDECLGIYHKDAKCRNLKK